MVCGRCVCIPDRVGGQLPVLADALAEQALLLGLPLECATGDEWVRTHTGRVSWVNDFYAHVVDALIAAAVWPHGLKATVIGTEWGGGWNAAELLVHNRECVVRFAVLRPVTPPTSRVDCGQPRKKGLATFLAELTAGWTC